MSTQHQAQVSLSIQKGMDYRQPVTTALGIELDGVGRIDIDFDEHTFLQMLGATNVPAEATVSFELTPPQKDVKAEAIAMLTELRNSLPAGHSDKIGVIRSIELLRVTL